MRNLIFLFLTLPVLAFGQLREFESFKVQNSKLIWQRVFEDQSSITAFAHLFSEIHQKDDQSITGRLSKTNYRPFLKTIGKNWGNTAVILWRSEYDATATIEIKDGRYRITLSDIYHHYDEETIDMSGPEEQTALKNNGDFRKSWINNIAPFLDKALINQFTIDDKTISSSDW